MRSTYTKIWLIMLLNFTAISELETALSQYNSVFAESSKRPIWAVAENYRFEPVFLEVWLDMFFRSREIFYFPFFL